jgi:hypothetical protein
MTSTSRWCPNSATPTHDNPTKRNEVYDQYIALVSEFSDTDAKPDIVASFDQWSKHINDKSLKAWSEIEQKVNEAQQASRLSEALVEIDSYPTDLIYIREQDGKKVPVLTEGYEKLREKQQELTTRIETNRIRDMAAYDRALKANDYPAAWDAINSARKYLPEIDQNALNQMGVQIVNQQIRQLIQEGVFDEAEEALDRYSRIQYSPEVRALIPGLRREIQEGRNAEVVNDSREAEKEYYAAYKKEIEPALRTMKPMTAAAVIKRLTVDNPSEGFFHARPVRRN